MKHMKMAAALAAMSASAALASPAEYGRKDGGAGGDIDIKQLSTEVADALKQVQDFATKAADSVKKGEELSVEAKAQIDEAMTKLNVLDDFKARLDDMEQKQARGGGDANEPRTAGNRFIESEAFKSFAAETRPRGRVQVDVKDISSLTTNAPGSVGTLVQPDRVAPVMLPQRRMTIRALLGQGRTSGNVVEYDRETLFDNNAAPVAEGAQKPQSDLQFSEVIAPVRTIAHWMRTSVQILADAPALASIIDQRLRYGLSYEEEEQLLNGSGTGQNLNGLVTNATAYNASFAVAAETQIDKLRLAMLQVYLSEYMPTGHVLNPIDWAVIETLKDADGRYLIGNPVGQVQPMLWGLPVVATQAMVPDKFLTGAFDLGAQIFDRQDATVEVSTEDGDNFQKNKVTIRAEARLALAIYRPQAFVYGDLGRVA